jgi:ABC-type phosphate transport system permease subunit
LTAATALPVQIYHLGRPVPNCGFVARTAAAIIVLLVVLPARHQRARDLPAPSLSSAAGEPQE